MKSAVLPVKNISRLSTAGRALTTRTPGSPGMGLVHGPTGYGKTTAVAWYSMQIEAIHVRAMATWTPAAMLGAILKELRQTPYGSCSAQCERIIETLSRTEQALFIDEADYIVGSKVMCETTRDLHDMATVPVILIGTEDIDQRLSERPQLTGRVGQEVRFEPLDLDDTALIARENCEVGIKPDLIDRIHRETKGAVRNIVVSLTRAEQLARSRGLSVIGSGDIARDYRLFTGNAPSPMQQPRSKVTPLRPEAGNGS